MTQLTSVAKARHSGEDVYYVQQLGVTHTHTIYNTIASVRAGHQYNSKELKVGTVFVGAASRVEFIVEGREGGRPFMRVYTEFDKAAADYNSLSHA